MSEDAIDAAEFGDAGSRGERRRALRAERERQAQRQAQREQPEEPPLVRPYAVTLQGQEAAVLVADAPGTSEGTSEGGEPSGGSAADAPTPAPPPASAPPPALAPAEPARAHSQDDDGPSLFTPEADAPSPPGRQPRVGPLPFDLPPFALPSDPQPSQWSAFTPVIPPEPPPFDDTRPTAWEPRQPWTSAVTTPSDSWMTLPPSPEPAEPDAEVSAEVPVDESAWTVPTPEDGVPVEPSPAQERVDERSAESAAGVAPGPGAPGTELADAGDEEEDAPPLTPRPGWSADLSRVELFRSALEDLAQAPDDAAGGMRAHEPPADDLSAHDLSAHDLSADDLSADDLPADDLPADELPVDELAADEFPVEIGPEEVPAAVERWDQEPSTGEVSTGEPATGELPVTELDVPGPSDDPLHDPLVLDGPPLAEERPSVGSSSDELPSDELPSDELPSDGLPAREESPRGELTNEELTDEKHPRALADGEGDGEDPSEPLSLAEPLAQPPAARPIEGERPDGPLPELGLPPVASAPAPPPPAPPADPPHPDDAHLPPLGRQPFGRAPTQRLAEALAHGEGPHPSEDDEPVRGTVAPVLRRSTERVRYPTSTMPVIRPPVMPPTPGSGIQIVPARTGAVSWQQALSGDVLPQAKKKRKPRRARVSKPRHESGGVGEYRPKVAADRSLTLLVVAMLLVLAGLVAAAVWTFWPSVTGGAGSLPPLGAPRAVGGP